MADSAARGVWQGRLLELEGLFPFPVANEGTELPKEFRTGPPPSMVQRVRQKRCKLAGPLLQLSSLRDHGGPDADTVDVPPFHALFAAMPCNGRYANSSFRRRLQRERARRFELLTSSLGKRGCGSVRYVMQRL
jgi:hypothetical protein